MHSFLGVILQYLLAYTIYTYAIESVFILDDPFARTYKHSLHKRDVSTNTNTSTSFVPFNTSIACTNTRLINGISICIWIQSSLTRTLQRLAQVVYLPVTVNVQCEVLDLSINSTILASAAPTRMVQFTAAEALALNVSSAYLYPSSLAKQYIPSDSVFASGSADISITMNGNVNWWFATLGDVGADLVDDKKESGSFPGKLYDFEQIAMHELLHGLGFISGWYNWIPELPYSFVPGYLNNFGNILGIYPPYAFDEYLIDVLNQTYMSTYASQIYATAVNITAQTNIRPQWIALFDASPAGQLARNIYTHIATLPQSLLSLFPLTSMPLSSLNGAIPADDKFGYAVLYTPVVFTPGSSISHVDANVYVGTADYLMRPFGTSGVGLDGYTPTYQYGPIGRAALYILKTLGYATAITTPA